MKEVTFYDIEVYPTFWCICFVDTNDENYNSDVNDIEDVPF